MSKNCLEIFTTKFFQNYLLAFEQNHRIFVSFFALCLYTNSDYRDNEMEKAKEQKKNKNKK